MEPLPSSWYQAIFIRKSRRSFHPRRPEEDKIVRLEKLCREFRPFPVARAELVRKSPDEVFRGIVGGYGRITGASYYIAFLGTEGVPHVEEAVGYMGEGLILEATVLGLGTCWVSGFFRPAAVRAHLDLPEGERVFAVTPVGYAEREYTIKDRIYRGIAASGKRKRLDEIVSGDLAEPWQRTAVEAARLAPSASNRQPWRFAAAPGSLTVRTDGGKDVGRFPKRLDCGIAMMHVAVGAQEAGAPGRWTLLDAPDVARFDISA
jgi:nitroreductase